MDKDEELAKLYGRWKVLAAQGETVLAEELCKDVPELLEEFVRALPRLKALDAVFHDAPETVESGAENLFDSLTYHKEGGLGVVFVGEDPELKRRVAVKCMKPRMHSDQQAVRRFIEEAEVTARLEHPGVVPIYRLSRGEKDQPFYAMRFVEGQTLAECIRRFYNTPAAPAERILEFRRLLMAFVTVCETIAYAHSRGIVHRDIKPDNIILGPFGETLVLDWGLAKCIVEPVPEPGVDVQTTAAKQKIDYSRSILGQAKGSPAFMSPEQARGDWSNVGPGSDVFGLGATLYALLTGTSPYSGTSAMELIEKAKQVELVPVRKLKPGVPRQLEAICLHAMEADPHKRYESPLQLAQDVNRWLADEPVSVIGDPLFTRGRRWLKRHQLLAATIAIAFIAVTLATMILGIQKQSHNTALQKANHELRVANEQQRQANYIKTVGLASRDFKEGDVSRALDLLSTCEPKRRNWEWHFLRREAEASYQTWSYRGEGYRDAVMSGDGTYVALLLNRTVDSPDPKFPRVYGDVQVAIFNASSGKLAERIDAPGLTLDDPILWWKPHLQISQNSRYVAISGTYLENGRFHGAVRCFDRTNHWQAIKLKTADFPDRVVKGVFFDKQDTLYALTQPLADAGSRDEPVDFSVVNCLTGTTKFQFKAKFRQGNPQLNRSGSVLLIAGGGISLIDFATGALLPNGDISTPGYATNARISDDDKYIACTTRSGRLCVFDFLSRKQIQEIEAHVDSAYDLRFSSANKEIVTTGWDGIIKRWRISDGELLNKVVIGEAILTIAVNSVTGQVVAPITIGKLAVWDSNGSSALRRLDPNVGPAVMLQLDFSPDGKRIFALEDELSVWDARSKQPIRVIDFRKFDEPRKLHVLGIASTHEGRLVAARRGNYDNPVQSAAIQVWNVDAGNLVSELPVTESPPIALAWNKSEKLVVAHLQDHKLVAFHAATGALAWSFRAPFPAQMMSHPHTRELYLYEINPGPSRIAVIDADNGKTIREFKLKRSDLIVWRFSFDGSQLIASVLPSPENSHRAEVVTLDSSTGVVRAHYQLSTQPEQLTDIFLSNDGTRLFTKSTKRDFRVYDHVSQEMIMSLRNSRETFYSMTLNADGLAVASTTTGRAIYLWDGRP